jgi:hypothetical protein
LQARGVILITSTVAAGDTGEMVAAGNGNGERGARESKSSGK